MRRRALPPIVLSLLVVLSACGGRETALRTTTAHPTTTTVGVQAVPSPVVPPAADEMADARLAARAEAAAAAAEAHQPTRVVSRSRPAPRPSPSRLRPSPAPVAAPAQPDGGGDCYSWPRRDVAKAHRCWDGLIALYNWAQAKAFAVMMCESGGNPKARNPHSTATGLFQILGGPTDPGSNVALAYSMYQKRGWKPWVCA